MAGSDYPGENKSRALRPVGIIMRKIIFAPLQSPRYLARPSARLITSTWRFEQIRAIRLPIRRRARSPRVWIRSLQLPPGEKRASIASLSPCATLPRPRRSFRQFLHVFRNSGYVKSPGTNCAVAACRALIRRRLRIRARHASCDRAARICRAEICEEKNTITSRGPVVGGI